MSTKHTPGPWELVSRGWNGQFIYGIDERAKGRRFIAEVDLNYDGAEANARLIAAAPELLAALRLMLAGTQEDCGKICMPSENAVRSAFAAIAKATGEQP